MSCQINIKKKRAILNKYDNTSEISIFTETPPHSSRFFFYVYSIYIYYFFNSFVTTFNFVLSNHFYRTIFKTLTIITHIQYKLKCYPLTSGDNCWIIKVLVFKCQIIPSAWEWNWEFLMIGDSMTTDTIEVSDGVIVRLKGTPVHNLKIQQCIFILHITV